MSQQLPKYLKKLKTFYNNFEGFEAIPQNTDSGDDTDTTSSGDSDSTVIEEVDMATTQQVEELLKKHTMKKTK